MASAEGTPRRAGAGGWLVLLAVLVAAGAAYAGLVERGPDRTDREAAPRGAEQWIEGCEEPARLDASPSPDGRHWASSCWRPYSEASPFNRSVPAGPRLHPRSRAIVGRLVGWGSAQDLRAGHGESGGDYFHPVFWSSREDPVYRVHCLRYRPCEIEGHRVRIPSRARPAAGSDGHMAVIDPRSGWEYDFWQVRRKPPGGGRLEVSHGGRTRIDGDGLGSNATAAHFGLAAGIIRGVEMEAGAIPHALFGTVRCSSGRSVYPAAPRTSGAPCSHFGLPNWDAPPLGARLWLDMSEAQIAGLSVPAWKKTILRAMADYGVLIGDTMAGNGSWGVQAESARSFTSFGRADPWRRFARSVGAPAYRGGYVLDIDAGVRWRKHLRVLHPCVSRGSC